MATVEMGGTSGGGAPAGWAWAVVYDDQTQQLTLRADGVGWGAVRMKAPTGNNNRTAVFLQPGQDPNVAQKPGQPSPASFDPDITCTVGEDRALALAVRTAINPRTGEPRFILDQAPWFPPDGWVGP